MVKTVFLCVCLTLVCSVSRGEHESSKLGDYNLQLENNVLKEELNRRVQVEEQLQKQIDRLEANFETLTASCQASREKKDVGIGDEIGFLATRLSDEHDLYVDQSIIFDSAITNIGNAYNPRTGQFVCPISGTYLFNMNVVSNEADYVEASIMVNGAHVVHALSDHKGPDITWDQGATAAILQLSIGDVVTVGIQWPRGANNVHGNKYTTFSGYLLNAYQ